MNKQEKMAEVDVREDLRLKKEPFDKVMGTVKEIKDGEAFVLHAPFNPIPLHKILRRKGFEYEGEKVEKKHWIVIYTKKENAAK